MDGLGRISCRKVGRFAVAFVAETWRTLSIEKTNVSVLFCPPGSRRKVGTDHLQAGFPVYGTSLIILGVIQAALFSSVHCKSGHNSGDVGIRGARPCSVQCTAYGYGDIANRARTGASSEGELSTLST